jgi:hypothetical protein
MAKNSHGSPAFVAQSHGPGSVAERVRLPARGPGAAGKKKVAKFGGAERDTGSTSGSAPKGMKTDDGAVMRRREALRERGAEPPPTLPSDTPETAHFTAPGHCPKCGEYVGRVVWTHALNCDGVKRESA